MNLDTILEDDSSGTGGVAFQGETLRDFLDEIGMDYSTDLGTINKALRSCGIKKIS